MEDNQVKYSMLLQEELPLLHEAFKSAFSNYINEFNTSLEALKYRMRRIGAELDHSIAIRQQDQIVAFIIQAIGSYRGVSTAYNGGTGVVPNSRGNSLSKQLYQFGFEYLVQRGIAQCLLEVITDNEPAFKVYKSLGFEVSREFICYKGNKHIKLRGNKDIHLLNVKDRLPDWELYRKWYDFEPCWQNSQDAVIRNFENETIIEAVYRTKTVGFIIFEPIKGTVTQMAVDPAYRLQKIGTQLLRAAGKLIVNNSLILLNVDSKAKPVKHLLHKCGFTEVVRQKEMIKTL
jgi:ribosomal protein S18 acetylase RimI-like enzyme